MSPMFTMLRKKMMGVDLYAKWGEETKNCLLSHLISWICIFIHLYTLHILSSVLSARCVSSLRCRGQELTVLGFNRMITELLSIGSAFIACSWERVRSRLRTDPLCLPDTEPVAAPRLPAPRTPETPLCQGCCDQLLSVPSALMLLLIHRLVNPILVCESCFESCHDLARGEKRSTTQCRPTPLLIPGHAPAVGVFLTEAVSAPGADASAGNREPGLLTQH